MINFARPLLSLLILICTSTSVLAQDYATERAEAIRLGVLLHEFDTSAWVASDALQKKKAAMTLFTETGAPKGWVTTEVEKGRLQTSFVADLNGKTVSVFDVVTRGKKVKKTTTHPQGRPLTEEEAEQLRAKAAMPLDEIEPCRDLLPMNTIAIPTDQPGELYVYLMSATKKPNVVVMGRHYRFKMIEGGAKVSETVQFTNTCLAIPTRGPAGSETVGVMSTHLRTPYPQEHHVFASLSHGKTLFVGTSTTGANWKVDGASIQRLSDDGATP